MKSLVATFRVGRCLVGPYQAVKPVKDLPACPNQVVSVPVGRKDSTQLEVPTDLAVASQVASRMVAQAVKIASFQAVKLAELVRVVRRVVVIRASSCLAVAFQVAMLRMAALLIAAFLVESFLVYTTD